MVGLFRNNVNTDRHYEVPKVEHLLSHLVNLSNDILPHGTFY